MRYDLKLTVFGFIVEKKKTGDFYAAKIVSLDIFLILFGGK